MTHPWKKIIEEIRNRNWTQKQFAILVWKKKRNITIQRDYILSQVLWTPEKYWINMQTDYDYEQMKQKIKEEKNNIQKFEVVEDVPKDNIQEIVNEESKKEDVVESWEKKNNKQDSPNNREVEVSQEEKQKKKEMRKVFINF